MINHAHRDGRVPNSAIQTSNLRSPHVETASRAVERSWSTLFLDLSICLFLSLFVFNLVFWDRTWLCRAGCPRTHCFYLRMCTSACLCTVCMQYPWRPEGSIGPPEWGYRGLWSTKPVLWTTLGSSPSTASALSCQSISSAPKQKSYQRRKPTQTLNKLDNLP